MIKLLHSSCLDITSVNVYGDTALSTAAGAGHVPVLEILLESFTKTVGSEQQLNKALGNAALVGNVAAVKILLRRGARFQNGRIPRIFFHQLWLNNSGVCYH